MSMPVTISGVSPEDSPVGATSCGPQGSWGSRQSAWYPFSALGFYPLVMGLGEHAVGSPLFTTAGEVRLAEVELVS
jgi:hypothetical protein